MTARPPLRCATRAVEGPPDLLALVRGRGEEFAFTWHCPERDLAMAALGVAAEVCAQGPERFERAAEQARALACAVEGPGVPRFVGGFGFADTPPVSAALPEFPPLRLVLPRWLWVRSGRSTQLTWIGRGAPDAPPRPLGSDPEGGGALPTPPEPGPQERHLWRRRVEAVKDLIAAGSVSKVVLARRCRLDAAALPEPAALLARARERRPSCYTFSVREGAHTFLASSPELLVRVAGESVEASALAGSAARAAGAAEDARLGRELLACPKNGREHAFVVAAIEAALGPVCAALERPAGPRLLPLPEAQHLETRVWGRLARRASAVELAGLLHPTPAACGVPREATREWLACEEPDRGWYTGAVGWMDAGGDGEFAVALRSALVGPEGVTLWAGAGIVEGSDPDRELEETRAKLRALAEGLAEVGDRAA